MIVRAINQYTDTVLSRVVEAGEHIVVPRSRGLKLISSGFARLVSEDDTTAEQMAKLNKPTRGRPIAHSADSSDK